MLNGKQRRTPDRSLVDVLRVINEPSKGKDHTRPASQTEKEQPIFPADTQPKRRKRCAATLEKKLSEEATTVQQALDEQAGTARSSSRTEKVTHERPSSRTERAPVFTADAPQPEGETTSPGPFRL